MNRNMNRSRSVLSWAVFGAVLAAAFLGLVYAPPDAVLGETQRILYVHVAAAWNGLLAFGVVFVGAIAYLTTRRERWDHLNLAAAEVGVLFTTIAVVTGSIWARVAWGVWWEWEPRLTSAFVLWLMYVGLLLVRRLVEEPGRRARFTAVFGIVAFVDVPVVFMSIRWWRSIHPVVIEAGKSNLEPLMVVALVTSVAAFTLLMVLLTGTRAGLEASESELAELKRLWLEGSDTPE